MAETLAGRGVEGRRLHTSHAFHSPMMDPILGAFTTEVSRIELHPPETPAAEEEEMRELLQMVEGLEGEDLELALARLEGEVAEGESHG